MERTTVFVFCLIFGVSCLLSLTRAAPKPQTDNDDLNFDVLSNQSFDYNSMLAHFKEFFMYLPVMVTTFKETMSGFPKLAEGIKILTSNNYEKMSDDNSECQCKTKLPQNSNEIDKSANVFR